MVVQVLLLLLGFVLLLKGADFLVEGSSNLARGLGIREIVIGLTVVAFGTSTPELVVNIFASAQNQSGLVLGNIIGSNIFNVLAILGVSVLIHPVAVEHNTAWREIPFALAAAVILSIMMISSEIGRGDGVLLLLLFFAFLVYLWVIMRRSAVPAAERAPQSVTVLHSTLSVLLGLVGLIAGGSIVVNAATAIATAAGISQKVIAVTIVATGTSLPELLTSTVAAVKGKNDIAVGNIVGSNVFNILLVLGLSSLIRPILVDPRRYAVDLTVLVVSGLFLFFTMFTGKRRVVDRWEGVLFLVCFAGYILFLLLSHG